MHILNSQNQLFDDLSEILEAGEVNIFDMRSVADLAQQYELMALYSYIKLYGYKYKSLLRSFQRWCEVRAKKRVTHYV